MSTETDPDFRTWYDADTVLRQEANRIHTGKACNARVAGLPSDPPGGAPGGAPPSDETWKDIPDDTKGMDLFKELHDRHATALCLSGGGVRSASFNVGVIEALAVNPRPDTQGTQKGDEQADDPAKSLLSQFDYLSTVSGGGYVGSWLSAWIARAGYQNVWPRLVGRRNRPDQEPSEIVWLRSYSNFLSPRLGLLSADTWAAIGLVIRNLVLNWLVIIPALCLALLAIKGIAIAAHWVPRNVVTGLFWPGLFAALLMLWALRYALASRPSCNPGILERKDGAFRLIDREHHVLSQRDGQRDELGRVGAGGGEARFILLCLLPALLAAFIISLTLEVRYFDLEKYPFFKTIFRVVIISVPAYAAAWLLARLQIAFRDPNNKPAKCGLLYWTLDLCAWMGAGLVYGTFIAVGIHMLAAGFGASAIQNLSDGMCADANICIDLQTITTLILLVLGIPWIVTAQLTAEMVFVGITNWEAGSDADREWFGRSTGWFTLVAAAWFFIGILVILGPPLVALLFAKFSWVKYGTAILGVLSGTASTMLGKGGKTTATDQAPQGQAWWSAWILPVSTIVFLVLLVLAVSAVLDELLFGHMLVESPLLGSGDLSHYTQDAIWFWVGVLVVGLLAAAASAFVNINRFSIHSLYRNRLIRGYLGASNPHRAPNPFTGFDDGDNMPMADLWPKRSEPAVGPWQPFHVINIALNVVNSKRLAWQERKAVSMTVSPLHCGTAADDLGYRPTCRYGHPEDGITLGTALAISGAAASPNMGYNSSPLVTLLLALFNVRLGWWLGNPGEPGARTYMKDGPRVAIAPFLAEMFGQTTDDQPFVYLSDGGHFENLGLYEMIRRRCRCIVVSDAGCDPDYDFTDLGNAVRKIAIDLGVYISFSELREIKRRSRDNTVIKGAYYAIGEIDYKTAPEQADEKNRDKIANGYILYVKPSYFGTESAGIVSYAAANAAFPHEPTFELFYGESQFESYRTLGFEILDTVLRQAKVQAEALWPGRSPGDPYTLCELVNALRPDLAKKTDAPGALAEQVASVLSAAGDLRDALERKGGAKPAGAG